MTLWNIIRDFFVQYIFGGIASNGNVYTEFIAGNFDYYYDGVYDETALGSLNDFRLYHEWQNANGSYTISIGFADWLSTTATIIVLIGICFALWHFVRWLFRLTAGLIRG